MKRSVIASENEPFVCRKCGFVELMGRVPFNRREKKNRMVKMDDVVFTYLKKLVAGFPNTNAAISYLLYKEQELEKEYEELDAEKDRFKDIIVQEVKE